MIRWAVFVSGEGTNLQNLLDLEKTDLKSQMVSVVVADRECKGIERGKIAKKATLILSPKEKDWTSKILSFLSENQIDSIFLLGYMRILPPDFLKAWRGRLVNLHPSWLPKYPGLDSIKRAFDAGEKFLGVSLHEVVEEVDAGKILRQLSFPVNHTKSFAEIMETVHSFERKIVRDYLLDIEI